MEIFENVVYPVKLFLQNSLYFIIKYLLTFYCVLWLIGRSVSVKSLKKKEKNLMRDGKFLYPSYGFIGNIDNIVEGRSGLFYWS